MPTIPETHRDLLDQQVAVLATIGPDGRPQLSAVFFVADADGTVRISLNDHRQKTRNLGRNPGVDVFILDAANPFRYLEIRGDAEIAPDPDYVFADSTASKYAGTDHRVHDKPGENRVVVTIRPVRINAVNMGG